LVSSATEEEEEEEEEEECDCLDKNRVMYRSPSMKVKYI
jgi:hypothetical protein